MDQIVKPLQHIAPPVGRVLIALLFIGAGLSKITGYTGTVAYMEMMGVPGRACFHW